TDSRSPDYLEVGGVSGGTVDLFPGYTLGEGRRTFPVRGFPAGAMLGMRAYAASLEYRAPFTLPGRGLGLWPAFLDRSSLRSEEHMSELQSPDHLVCRLLL